jgi:hypothetical protein
MKGPAISVRCDCGQVRAVPYRETWTCEQCGRRWNTSQIPEEQYRRIVERVKVFKLQAVRGAILIAIAVGALSLVAGSRMLLFIPVALAVWFIWLVPRRRNEIRAYARSLPRWDLTPE